MFLTAQPFYPSTYFTPTRPSPLSDRSANVLSRPFSFNMASQPSSNEKKVPVPQRAYKPNPVMRGADAVKQTRRDMFFRKVQREREEKKWGSRGDQLQRLDFISDQKRWEARKERQAPTEPEQNYFDENDFAGPSMSYNANIDTQMEPSAEEAEYILQQEQQELEALIALMEEEQTQGDQASQHYGSDDDDYDQIFMECVGGIDMQGSSGQDTAFVEEDAMDTSGG
ncbi:hypothetical protein P154DRAFT_520803 [Amniculicola lignicola CBS 123094]|uniref:Uncharacterized protein n=1 Tax=Amniculicola lignicola CBS 123094 TaxID=1392246 RepID=A0A6A5WPJ5_9PLEO|nr:hypothetical protein P154DRAFT_520803 [Amniculicola lignicola CBS 123094]